MIIRTLHKLLGTMYRGLGFASRYAAIRGHTLHYYESRGEKRNHTLVLLHGLGTSASTWAFALPTLRALRRVVALDQAAYDRYSTRPDDVLRGGKNRAYHAHQLYVGIAAETGLIGLFALFAAIVLCIRWYWQAPAARRDQAWPYALSLVIYAFPINSQSVLYSHRLFPVLLLLLGGMLAALDRAPADDAPGKQV